MPVNTRHLSYTQWERIWQKSRDADTGQEAIKLRSTIYLPNPPGMTEQSYNGYLHRAQFINFTARTVSTSLGQIFRKNPLTSEDFISEETENDIDLSGRSLVGFSRMIAKELLLINRVGVWLDYN